MVGLPLRLRGAMSALPVIGPPRSTPAPHLPSFNHIHQPLSNFIHHPSSKLHDNHPSPTTHDPNHVHHPSPVSLSHPCDTSVARTAGFAWPHAGYTVLRDLYGLMQGTRLSVHDEGKIWSCRVHGVGVFCIWGIKKISKK